MESLNFEFLRPWSRGYRSVEVATKKVEITKPVHRIVLAIPAPPSDEELMRREK